MAQLIIVGAGGFGREVMHWLKDCNAGLKPGAKEPVPIKGFLSEDPQILDGFDVAEPILGSPLEYRPVAGDRFVLAIGEIESRKRVVEAIRQKGGKFESVVHPAAVVASTAKIGEGVVICPFALVSDRVVLEDFTVLNFFASCGHDAVVGRYSTLSPYATLNGRAVLENEVFLGTHATVTGGVQVGAKAKIAANSVAHRDVKPRTLVQGPPSRSWSIF